MGPQPECPKRELHHYVPEWIQRGFCGPKGNLYAFRLDDGRLFRTGPRRLYARQNQNTVWSEDSSKLLAYSENSYRYLDGGAAPRLLAVRDAARQASWSATATGVSGFTAALTSWLRGALLMQYTRTAAVFGDSSATADAQRLNAGQRRVVAIAAAVRRPKRMEAVLRGWSPIICRSSPRRSFILGDDIVLFGVPIGLPASPDAQQVLPFMGMLVDQHTLIGFTEPACQRFRRESGEAEVVQLSDAVVDEVCRRIAANATTVAASSAGRAEDFGRPEYARRLAECNRTTGSAVVMVGGRCDHRKDEKWDGSESASSAEYENCQLK